MDYVCSASSFLFSLFISIAYLLHLLCQFELCYGHAKYVEGDQKGGRLGRRRSRELSHGLEEVPRARQLFIPLSQKSGEGASRASVVISIANDSNVQPKVTTARRTTSKVQHFQIISHCTLQC